MSEESRSPLSSAGPSPPASTPPAPPAPPAGVAAPELWTEYRQRHDQQVVVHDRAELLGRRLSWSRLVVFLAGLGVSAALPGIWYLPASLAVVGFLTLVFVHERTLQRRQRAARTRDFYARGLARLEERWAGAGRSGERFADPEHPYADDLDLFGSGSLFEALCTTHTAAGEQKLASWLLAPADPAEVRGRQAAVAELRPRLDLREDLARLGDELEGRIDRAGLTRWAEAPLNPHAPALRWALAALAFLAVAATVGWAAFDLGPWPLLAVLAVEAAVARWLRPRLEPVIEAVERPAGDLALLAALLGRLEAERFSSPHLVRLRSLLDADGAPPSRQVARLQRLVGMLEARENNFFGPISRGLLWATQLGCAIEAWRARCGPAVGRWLEGLAELEALGALACWAHEHPGDVFPELVDLPPGGQACFEARALAHPLLPSARAVRNDLRLDDAPAILIVSGSNMSGKSTLLRAVGVNAVLAQAGAPVRAEALRLTPLDVGASLLARDSLRQGVSRFYAEILRLRQVLDIAAGPRPLLFLLDELLHGTNSHDRAIGATAIVEALVQRRALGLLTTHDLALAPIAERLAPRTANVHLEDQLVDGKIRFDYQLRPGVVRRSNALELMRAVGLEV